MEKSLKRMEIWIILLIILVVINLSLTLVVYKRSFRNISVVTDTSLPDQIEIEKNNIVNKLIPLWNSHDIKGLYGLMGDISKRMLSFETFEQQTKELLSFGDIKNPRYIRSRYEGEFQGHNAYDLIYSISLGGKNGSLTISLIGVDDSFQLLGYNLSTNYVAPD